MNIETVRTQLKGRKTYLLVAAAVLTAIAGWADGQETLFQAAQAIMAAVSAGAARAGIAGMTAGEAK